MQELQKYESRWPQQLTQLLFGTGDLVFVCNLKTRH